MLGVPKRREQISVAIVEKFVLVPVGCVPPVRMLYKLEDIVRNIRTAELLLLLHVMNKADNVGQLLAGKRYLFAKSLLL